MTEARKLSLVDTRNCPQYKTEAKLFIEDEHPSGLRQLVVQYEGRPDFAAAIPDDWTEQDISDFLLRALDAVGTCPLWEVPERLYGSPVVFRWWAGERPD
jgi:hypothetical protein